VFGGLVAAGEQIWRGGMICWNAGGALQRLQTAGSVSFAGMASKDYNNTASAVAACSPPMEALKGVYALTVPNAGFANIEQPVYATDDNTFTLSNALSAAFARGSGDTELGWGVVAPCCPERPGHVIVPWAAPRTAGLLITFLTPFQGLLGTSFGCRTLSSRRSEGGG